MPKYSKRSKSRLSTCHEDLQKIFNEVIKHIDCTILEGYRGKERQDRFFEEGKTKVKYPDGRHNFYPSRAIDVTPYPVAWDDRDRQILFAGFVLGVGNSMDIELRWGGDWNMNYNTGDNPFDDYSHFELVDENE